MSQSESGSDRATLKREAKHASVYAACALLTKLGQILLLPLFWEKLTLADFGVIGVTDILMGFLAPIWGLSLDASISRFYYEWPEAERRRRLGGIWLASWASILILGSLSILLIAFVGRWLFPEVPFAPYLVLGLTYAMLQKMRDTTFTTIRIIQKPLIYASYSAGVFVAFVTSSVYFVLIADQGLFGYLLALNVSELVMLLGCVGLMLRFSTPAIRNTGLRESLRFSLPLIPNAFIGNLSSVTDRFLLQRFAPVEALGIYTLALRFTGLIGLLHSGLKMSFAPFIFRTASVEGSTAPEKIGFVRLYYLLPLFIAGFAIVAYIRPFVRLVGQPQYLPVCDYVPLLLGPAILLTFNAYYASGLLLAKRTELLWIPTTVKLILLVATGVFLVPLYQLPGVVASQYITTTGFVVAGIILSQKYYYIPANWPQVISLSALLAFAIVAGTFLQFTEITNEFLALNRSFRTFQRGSKHDCHWATRGLKHLEIRASSCESTSHFTNGLGDDEATCETSFDG